MNGEDELTLIERLIEIGRRAESEGLCRHKTGNFSILDRSTGNLYITPSGMERRLLTPSDMITADLSGKILSSPNGRRPSIELGMHIAVYKARKDMSAIVHTHSTFATAFSVKGMKISPVAAEASFYGNHVELVDFAPPGSEELAALLTEPVCRADVCLLRNHGLLAVGKTIEDAYLKAAYAEEVAKIEYIARTL